MISNVSHSKIHIYSSMDEEFDYLSNNIEPSNNIEFIKTGIGKIKTVQSLMHSINSFDPDIDHIILNIGLAGSLNKYHDIGDIFFCKRIYQNDFDIPVAADLRYLNLVNEYYSADIIQGYNYTNISCGDRFITDRNQILINQKDAYLIDMESFAMASTIASYHPNIHKKFYCIKAVSDIIYKDGNYEHFKQNMWITLKKLKKTLGDVLNTINNECVDVT